METIRFLVGDQGWVRALIDGACSIGRLSAADQTRATAAPPPLTFPTVTGALIRSAVVAGYPGLLVDAYADAARTQLRPLRTDRLSSDAAAAGRRPFGPDRVPRRRHRLGHRHSHDQIW